MLLLGGAQIYGTLGGGQHLLLGLSGCLSDLR